MRSSQLNIMGFCPEHPKWDQNPKFTPPSEMTSTPTCFICRVPPPPAELYYGPPLTPTFRFNACNCHLTLSLCIFINVDIIFTFRWVILLPFLIPFFPSVYFFDLPFLYFYLYTSYYLVYGTFICMANFSFQFLLLETSDIKLDFMESKLWSAG